MTTTNRPLVQFFSVTAEGPVALPVPAGAKHAHELFDDLPLGVYSAFRTFEHDRFLGLEQHFERTDRSMELLGWPQRLDRLLLRRTLHELCSAYPGPDAFVRFDVLSEEWSVAQSRTLIALSPYVPVSERYVHEGVGVRFTHLKRERPLIKTASFVLERRPYPLGRQDAYEHLLVDETGSILEGTSSNFLALIDGRLRATGDGALKGVTQGFVIRLAREAGLTVERGPVVQGELPRASEAFLTGSTRGIVPVVSIEGREVGSGRPGAWTQRLIADYRELTRRESSPAWPRPDRPSPDG